MNKLITELARFCNNHLLDEKILVSPSLSVGHQITESLVRAGCPWINLRVATIGTLAHGIVADDLVRENRILLSRMQELVLVERACAQESSSNTYFSRLVHRTGFHRAVRHTINDLQRAAVLPDDLDEEIFEDADKARELNQIYCNYRAALEEHGLIDRCNVLHRAIEKLSHQSTALREAYYIVPQDHDLTHVERKFLETIAGDRLVEIPVDDFASWQPARDKVELFRSLGEENEVREILRRILSDHIHLDDVEIIYTDDQTYLPLIFEFSLEHNIPCKYAQGIPVLFTCPGKAVAGFLSWLGGDYDARVLRRIVASGHIVIRTPEGGGNSLRASRVLRNAAIGWGRDRYLPCLDIYIRQLVDGLQTAGSEDDDENDGSDDRSEWRKGQLEAAQTVRGFIARVFELIPKAAPGGVVSFIALCRAVATFTREFARVASEMDGKAARALFELYHEMSLLPDIELPFAEAVARLENAISDYNIDAGTPEPGYAFASDYRAGGYTGRKHTFVVGLDESRHPGSGLEDPVFLDTERKRLNHAAFPREIPLHSDQPAKNSLLLNACIARLSSSKPHCGHVTFSYSCWNIIDDREQFPAPVLLDIYRRVTGHIDADYAALNGSMGARAGFVPAGRGRPLNETEWLLSRLDRTRGQSAVAAIHACYPWLANGWLAEQKRNNDRFTEFDGRIRALPSDLDPRLSRQPVSARRLEMLARCPFSFFIRYVLGIQPCDDLIRDPMNWLSALEFGILMHEVLQEFMESLKSDERPSLAAHQLTIETIADATLQRWRHMVPAPNETAFKRRRDKLMESCRVFLHEEEAHCKEVQPFQFEVAFGMGPTDRSRSPLSIPDPVEIDLGNGESFLLCGRIDRIDRTPDGNYEIWDYKSGDQGQMKEPERLQFDRGRQLQHGLYTAALNRLLARAGEGGTVVRAGYFYPGARAPGHRISFRPDPTDMSDVVRMLFDVLRSGQFFHAPDEQSCRYCDFSQVCGGADLAIERAQRIRSGEIARSPELSAIRRLVQQ